MILPDFESLYSDFSHKGYAGVNVLDHFPQCKSLSESINNLSAEHWLYIIKNNQLEKDFTLNQPDEIKRHYQIACEDYENGDFAFAFSRIFTDTCSLTLPVFKSLHDMFADNIKSMASKISGRSLEKMSVFYITRFDKGDFLTTHCDSGNSVGVVLNLSIEWRPEHGGLTVIYPQDDELLGHTYFPALGNLFVFDVSERKVLHFVSEVTVNRQARRISVVARYD